MCSIIVGSQLISLKRWQDEEDWEDMYDDDDDYKEEGGGEKKKKKKKGGGEDDFEEEDLRLDKDEIVVRQRQVEVEYTYPLTRPVRFTHTTSNPDGFSRREICEQIMQKYHDIFAEEEADAGGDPGTIPGMWNRQTTQGRYGIWGHSLDQLVLHTIIYHSDTNTCTLGIDS
jgi:hypothetical protein